jgi:putative restriction endonuclease
VTPERRVEVSRRIREEWQNGKDYYALHGQAIRSPIQPEFTASAEYLDWHASNVFLG